MGGCVNRNKQKSAETVLPARDFVETNTQLDLWTEAQIHLLQQQFHRHRSALGLDKSCFLALFPALQSFPPPLQESLFHLFHPAPAGFVTFRNFCLALSKLLNGNREERVRMLFQVFDVDKDGKLNGAEVKMMLETCKLALGTTDFEGSLATEEMPLEDFLTWARANLDIGEFLRAFEVLPSPATERNVIRAWQIHADRGDSRQRAFLVSAKWWDAWKRYVGYDITTEKEGRVSGSRGANRHASYVAGDRPVEIDNNDLVEPGTRLVLRAGLKGRKDYVLLVPEAWSELHSWYGGGPELARFLLRQGSLLVPELYPCKVMLYLADGQGKLRRDMARAILVSESAGEEEVRGMIRETLQLEDNTQFRVWVKEDMEWVLTQKVTCEHTSPYRDLLIELATTYAGVQEWPRDKAPSQSPSKDWKHFQVGDHLQIQRAPSFWTEAVVRAVTTTDLEVCLIRENSRIVRISRLSEDLIPMSQRPVNVVLMQGKLQGVTGLGNLGNTCYINCIVQCLATTPLLKDLFGSGSYSHYVNYSNLKGFRGQVAEALGSLMHTMQTVKDSTTSPSGFMAVIRRLFPQFSDNFQHDCHEFLSILLSSLHEDLLRISSDTPSLPLSLSNPSPDEEIAKANDQWKALQGGNGSVISDLCAGQTKTTLTCRTCGLRTVLFETFLYLSLPIPVSMEMSIFVTVVRRSGGVRRYGLRVGKLATLGEVVEKLAAVSGVDREEVVVADMDSAKIFRLHDSITAAPLSHLGIFPLCELLVCEVPRTIPQAEARGKATQVPAQLASLPLLEVGHQVDVLTEKEEWTVGLVEALRPGKAWEEAQVVYEFGGEERVQWVQLSSGRLASFRTHSKPGKDEIYLFPLVNRLLDQVTGKMEPLGTPVVLGIGSWYTYADLHEEVAKVMGRFVRGRGKMDNSLSPSSAPYQLKLLDPMGFQCCLCGPNCQGCPLPSKKTPLSSSPRKTMLALDWAEGAYNWDIEQDPSVAVAEAEEVASHQRIDIQDCLRELTREENVEMKCEKCGETETSMKMEIWRTPDILILNLKRFFAQAGVAEKIDQMVDYPLYAFDISEFLPSCKPLPGLTMSTTSLQSAYDLYSLVNHAGSMEGGHYTAFVLRKQGQEEDQWMLVDDERLLEVVGDSSSVVRSKNAYLLFYRRRLLAGSNVINLTSPY